LTVSKEITKKRVHVRKGSKFAGCRGWAFFTEDQGRFDSISVRLDRAQVEDPNRNPTGPATTPDRWAFDTSTSHTRIAQGHLVRFKRIELEVLSDLEALAEVDELPSLPHETPKLLE
jgi:hypothetical protein